MIINYSKTKEIVFYRPHPSKFSVGLHPSFDNIQLVHDAKLLGVTLTGNLSFENHVQQVLACCSKRFYLLKNLRDGGMPIDKIDVIFCSLIVNRIAYCLNAWGGYLNDEQIGRIDALFKRAKRYGFTRFYYDYRGIMECSDFKIFQSICEEQHCLHYILPPTKDTDCRLRARGHNFVLPRCQFELYKKSFLPRCLYKFV
jgi:hypothetical protein